MITKELYINNSLIDLKEGETIAFSYQVNDIAQMEDRQANYSNEFEVLPSGPNQRALGFPNIVTTNSNAPYRKLPCSYYENGIPIIENGFAIIKGTKDNIKITVYSGIYDFFQQIADRSIKELDFSELDHLYTIPVISNLNALDGPLTWPAAQYGAMQSGSNVIDIRYQAPQIKFAYVLDKIWAQTDYGKSGLIFNDVALTELNMTLTPNELVDSAASRLSKQAKLHTDRNFLPEFAGKNNLKFDRNDFNSKRYPWYLGGSSNILVANLLSLFKDTTSGDAYQGSASPMRYGALASGLYPGSNQGYYYPDVEYVAKSFEIVDLNFHVYANGRYGPSSDFADVIRVFIVVNNSYFVDNGFLSGQPYYQYVSFYDGLMDFSVKGIRLRTGDTVRVYCSEAVNIWAHGQTDATKDDYSFIEFVVTETAVIGEEIKVNSLIPDIKMTDFVRNFANLFGIIFSPAKNKKEIICTQFKEITANIANSTDWSNRLHTSEAEDITYRIGNYARSNWMLWAADDSTAGYGDYAFSINDTTLDKTFNVFQLEFSSSVPFERLLNWPYNPMPAGGNTGVTIPRYTLIDAEAYSPLIDYFTEDLVLFNKQIWRAIADSSNVTPGSNPAKWVINERQFDQTEAANPRLLYSRKVQGAWVYEDGITNDVSSNVLIAYFDDPLQIHSLGFQFIQKDHYTDFIRMLTKLKALSVKMLLTKNDIHNLNFLVPVYVAKYQNYFYLNKVNEYIADQPTVVDIIRL